MRRIPLEAQPVMPWANGGGSTRQVAIDPPDGSLAKGFRWRLSIAQVASSGPFSRLPGIDRTSWLLAGDGLRLDVDGREVVLAQPLQRFDFAGETPIHCTLLGGPCEDLNVMVARAQVRAEAELRAWSAGEARILPPVPERVVVVVRGRLEDPRGLLLADAGDALCWDDIAEVALRAAVDSLVLAVSFARSDGPGRTAGA